MCTRTMPLSGIGSCVYVYLSRFLSVYILFAAGDTMIKAKEQQQQQTDRQVWFWLNVLEFLGFDCGTIRQTN